MNYNIPKIAIPDITEEDYFNILANGIKVKPLTKACANCAITTGFYMPIAVILKNQNREFQDKVADTWFCHNNCKRGCGGLRNFLKT